MNKILSHFQILDTLSLKETLRQMGVAKEKVLFVVDQNNRLLGSISDGDIRRWILSEGGLSENIGNIYNKSPRVLKEGHDISQVKRIMIDEKLEALPVVDRNGVLINILFWRDVFSEEQKLKRSDLNVPALIMAGGKGTRMDPLTRILPKPLIPIGERPIIEIIMERFMEFGCRQFYVTLNYKGKMIQSYFDSAESKYDIHFVWEETPYGTAGGIRLASDRIDAPHFFVSNCDILVKADYHDIFRCHVEENHDLTIVGSMKHFTVPYGVLEVKNGGLLQDIVEKPEYDFIVNTGMYLVKSETARLIPPNTKLDFPELIQNLKKSGGKIGIYPVGEHSWIDIGQWQEYQKAIKIFDP